MSKTLQQLREQVRRICREQDGDTGLFDSQAGLDQFINTYYFCIYQEACNINPDAFSRPSQDMVLTNNGIDTKAPQTLDGVHLINGVDVKDGDDYYILDPVNRRENRVGWYYENGVIRAFPKLQVPLTVRIWWVPAPTEMGDGDEPFGGMFPAFHDLVGYGAAIDALDADETPTALMRAYNRMHKNFTEYIGNIVTALPRRVLDISRDTDF